MTDRADRYLDFARAYAEAGRRLLATGVDDDTRLPFFAIVAHGLELALKSILSRSGWDEERLMMIGHDLDRCHAAVSRCNSGSAAIFGAELAGVINLLAYPHALQSFRYPQAEPRDLPGPALALECVNQVLDIAGRYRSEPRTD